MKRRHKQFLLIGLVMVAAVIGTVLAYTLFNTWYIVDRQVREVRFEVVTGSAAGFDLNTTYLAFGKVPAGGGGLRRVTLQSKVPSVAYSRTDPGLSAWLSANETRVVLGANTPKTIEFDLSIPENTTMGNYTGVVQVVFFRRMPWE